MEPYRILEEHAVYFVTFTVVEWLPVFVGEEPCQIVVESLNYCHRERALRTNAYVIMPSHLHAVFFDAGMDAQRLAETITALRKHTGRQLSEYVTNRLPAFDRILRASAAGDRQRHFWQESRHPEAIYTPEFWRQKVEYLHLNPCKSGLVRRPEDWRYSSAAWWMGLPSESDVILTPLEG